MPTTVVNKKVMEYDVYIGRGSKWGNPYTIGIDGTREEVIEKYRLYLLAYPDLIAMAQVELRDKVLGCFCTPLPCHGEILSRIANGEVW